MSVNLATTSTFGEKANYYNKKNKHFDLFCPRAYNYYPIIIRLFHTSKMWRIYYRLFILIFVVASFPFINSSFPSRRTTFSDYSTLNNIPQKELLGHPIRRYNNYDNSINMVGLLTHFFNDLIIEGLMTKKPQKNRAIFLSNEEEVSLQIVNNYKMDYIPLTNLEKQDSLLDNTVDFFYTTNLASSLELIDRTLRIGGIVSMILKDDPSFAFSKPSNYKIEYTRRFNLIALAMKKIGPPTSSPRVGAQRKLLRYASEAKKVALQNLEDVLLEPPRAASGKSRVYLKRTRYLPDLMGDSLESYPRRVFIDVGLPEKDGGSGTDWFYKNYPTRNKNFETYKIETIGEESSKKGVPQIEMSDWLRKNVRDEEYVVMKAEAEVVEEMMRTKAIMLVDELFLECKPSHSLKLGYTNDGNNNNKNNNGRSRRAYWECLALY